MRRITFGLFFCVLAVTGCAPGGGGGSSAPPARSAQGAFAVPQAISRAVPPPPPNFVPKPPSTTTTSSVRHTSGAAQAAFFSGAVALSNGVYYLQLPGGNIFGYYSYLPDPNYIYHFDMGYEYVFDAGDGLGGVYLYDFSSSHWWYTGRTYEFPFVFDFSLNSVAYYYADAQNAGHYTTNPRYFFNFAAGQIIQIPGPPLSTKATQRAQAQALLTVSKVLDTGGYYPGFATLGPMDRGRRAQSVRSTRSAACSPGGANGDGSALATTTSDAQGRHDVYSDYYSPNCVNPERITTLNLPTSNTVSQGVSTGYTTEYNRAGAAIGYATNQQTYGTNLLTVFMSDAKTPGGAQAGRSGASCVPTSSTAVRCNLASFMMAGGEMTGLLETVTETYNSSSGAWTAQISATTYADSGLSLVQPAAGGSTWGIQGGTQIDALSGSGTAAYSGSFASQLDYTTTSSPGGYSATAHLSTAAHNTLTITVSKNGAAVATAVVDGDGNGTITYAADNTTDTVAGFTIFS
ncbi:MAG TPA: hypothetical protein VN224_03705 [Xanthomonadales bacterium]|nr:hypothetical protein [Xanthomonadales bacterium]